LGRVNFKEGKLGKKERKLLWVPNLKGRFGGNLEGIPNWKDRTFLKSQV